MFPPQRTGFSHHLAQDRIFAGARPLEVLVNDDHVVAVSRELKENVVFEKTEVHLVTEIDQLRHDQFLVFRMIDADERRLIPEIERVVSCSVFIFLLNDQRRRADRAASPSGGLVVDPARFLG